MEMAARPIGADQHQRADRTAGGAFDLSCRRLDTAGVRLRLQLAGNGRAGLLPIVRCAGQLVAFRQWPIGAAPRRTARIALYVGAIVFQALEERLPSTVDRFGISLVAGVKVFDIAGVAAVQKRRAGES